MVLGLDKGQTLHLLLSIELYFPVLVRPERSKLRTTHNNKLVAETYSIDTSRDNKKVKAVVLKFDCDQTSMSENLTLRGTLKGHADWVTSLATTPEDPNLLLSSSRDKSVIVWQLTHSSTGEDDSYGYARRALRGHSHFVSDVVISSDGAFALSASWDSELRLWDIATGKTTRRFVGHEKDVLSVAFSVDNRQIVSGKSLLC